MLEIQSTESTQPKKVDNLPQGELWQALDNKNRVRITELVTSSMSLAENLPEDIRDEVLQCLKNIKVHAGLVNADSDHWHQIKMCLNRISKLEWRSRDKAA